MVNGRVCANSNCHHTELEHVSDMCWGKPKQIRTDGPTPGCRCKGFVAKRGEVKIEMTQDKMDERFVTAFERIATALETIAWKQAVTLFSGTTPNPAPASQPWQYPWQHPVISSVPAQPNGVVFSKTEAVSQPDGFAVSFNDLVEGEPITGIRVGTGG